MKTAKRIRQLREMYRPFLRAFAVLLGVIIAAQALKLVVPYYYGKVVDGLVSKEPIRQLYVYAFTGLAILILSGAIEWLRGWYHVNKIAFDVEKHIEKLTLERILRFSIGQVTNTNSGFKQDVLKKGEAAISETVEMLIFQLIPSLARVAIATLALFYLNAAIGAITLVSIILFIWASIRINTKMLPELKRSRRMGTKLGTAYWELIKHLRLVMISNQEKGAVSEYCEGYDKFGDHGKALWSAYMRKIALMREPFGVVGQFLVLVAGIYLVYSGVESPGQLVVVLGWSMSAFGAIDSVGSMQRRLSRGLVQIEKYFDLLEVAPAIVESRNPIKPDRFSGRIEFKNVSFQYPEFESDPEEDESIQVSEEESGSHAIVDVSFVIEPGTVCAFVGHSGSGKSTTINLLLRGYDPDKGQILIDGHDLRLLDCGNWRKSIGVVEQEPKLWDETLGYNMTYGLNGERALVSDEELETLARKTRITEFYHRLGPRRFETQIGENGVQLSGGQRQRVAIARAIAKYPSLLILDEATNALDPMNEHLVHEAIREAMVGRTGIIIAHRLSTIRHADQIIVFEKGTVVGNGKHDDLMRSCAQYQGLVMREVGTLTV